MVGGALGNPFGAARGAWTRAVLAVLLLLPLGAALAHPGHADPVTISRNTAGDIKQIVPLYLQVQEALAAERFDAAAAAAAERLQHVAGEANGKEKDPSGQRMYRVVGATAGRIAQSPNIDTARRHFSDLSDALLPFLDSWPSHREAHGSVIYVCKTSEQWWMQKQGAAIIPYAGGMAACGELAHTKQGKE
ncbi:MAG: hypothetical protein FD165_204 [Gammaproteobacteria bacterium]|nr:MAG: hypothetical protein FD165_204 [Gammaproteobacteria bacterium]TND06782.1 MAG: hypothetical protein FD120_514 [Gammaproteobacteria bacterium]